MRRLLVLGGGGFVGGRLVRLALARGMEVTVAEARGGGGRIADLVGKVALLETGDNASVRDAVAAARFDAAVWAAGHNPGEGLARAAVDDVAAAVAGNAGTFAAFLLACAAAGVPRVVACGSSVVYGPASLYPGPVDEVAPPAPVSAYGMSKRMAEVAADWAREAHGLDVTTLRLPLVLGPGRWYGGAAAPLARLLDAAARGAAACEAVPDGPFDAVHGDDAAAALLVLATRRGTPAILNLTGFVATWAGAAGALRALRPGAAVEVAPRRDPGAFPLMDGSRLRAATGFEPNHDLRTTLADALTERMETPA